MIKQVDFSRYSSIQCGPVLDVVIINDAKSIPKDHTIIGKANNILVSPGAKNLMMLSKNFDFIKKNGSTLTIGAATTSGKIVSYCKKNNLAGLEFLNALPGALGGLIKMNAGLLEYTISDNLLWVKTESGTYSKSDLTFNYRECNLDETVLQACFFTKEGFDVQILQRCKEARKNQPKGASAGSCFKNPKGDYAGRLIEAVGLKGYKKGAFTFSCEHANFLLNLGGGKFEDAKWLIQKAQNEVKSHFNIDLELEIQIL